MLRTLLFAVPAAALALLLAPSRAASAPPTAVGPGGILQMHAQLLAALDAGDGRAVAAHIGGGESTTLFLCEPDAEPVVAMDRKNVCDELIRWAERSAKAGEWSSRSVPVRVDCPTSDLSYAIMEIERRAKGSKDVERYHSTALVEHRGGKFKIVHWHLSPARDAKSLGR